MATIVICIDSIEYHVDANKILARKLSYFWSYKWLLEFDITNSVIVLRLNGTKKI